MVNGLLDVVFDASLVDNDELLSKVAAHNAAQNQMTNGTSDELMTYLLPQVKCGLDFSTLGPSSCDKTDVRRGIAMASDRVPIC